MYKLVRDRLGQRIHATEGRAIQVRRLLVNPMLREKLLEEAEEVSFAAPAQLVEELADLATVVAALRRSAGIPAWRVWWARLVKWVRLGGFSQSWAIKVKDGVEYRTSQSR